MPSAPVEKTIHAEYEDVPQDEDSLFGSPPPSPSARGRSPSPALALPSAVSTGPQLGFGSIAQNVGTIALPGSRTHSEQPINPIASSLSLPGGSCTPLLPQSLPSSQPQSRQGSIGRNESPYSASPQPQAPVEIGRMPTQARRQPLKRKPKATTPRPPPPAIPLPDPSQPPPAHFLRNQQGLLGHAGLIAGVKPSNLTTLHGTSRGASPSNPIVLDDTETGIFCEPSTLIGRSHIEYFKNFDRSRLPKPTIQEVVDMLIKQKDIFFVLQNILKLLAGGAIGVQTASASTSTRGWSARPVPDQSSSRYPVKKRKLSRVPAGAADWDVPYPFLEGEGPEAYKQNWMKERGRQLVSQLIGLVKVALDKAAAKKHLEELAVRARSEEKQCPIKPVAVERSEGGKGADHYRDVRADVSLPVISLDTVQKPPVSSPPNPSVARTSEPELNPRPTAATTCSDNTTFNDLFSALLSASDSSYPASSDPAYSQVPSSLENHSASHSTDSFLAAFDASSSDNETADQSLIDSWMNILQTFPLPEEGFTACGTPSADEASFEALFKIDTPSDFSAFASPVSGDLSSFSTTPNPDAQQSLTFPPLDLSQSGNPDMALNFVADGGSDTTNEQTSSHPNNPQHPDKQSTSLEAAPMDLDVPKPPESQINSSSVPLFSMDIDSLIDPRLLSLSLSGASQTEAPSTRPSASTNNGEIQTSSTFLPSPPSTLEPATPSSADWDTNMPQVALGTNFQHGTWWDAFLASIAVADSTGGKGSEQFAIREGSVGISKDMPTQSSGLRAASRPPSQRALSKPRAPPATSIPSASAPPQPAGVFSVLRVKDWQPPEPQRKPKKTEVLKKAEETREALKTRLEQVKVKLWEATIEHAALLQLMRMSGEEEGVPSSSLSPSGS